LRRTAAVAPAADPRRLVRDHRTRCDAHLPDRGGAPLRDSANAVRSRSMKVHPLFAVVCVCSAAGVVAWDVRWFAKSHGEAITTTPEPATSDAPGDGSTSANSATASPSTSKSPSAGAGAANAIANDDDVSPKSSTEPPKKAGDVD